MLTFATATAAALAVLAPTQSYAPQDDGPQRVAPRGSYARSCSGSYVNQGRLYADCRDTRGNVRGSSIELNRCSDSDIGNDNGLLVCYNVRGQFEDRRRGDDNGGNRGGGWGGNNGGGWGGGNGGGRGGGNGGGWGDGYGGGRNSIIVYSDSNYRGSSQTLRGEVEDLRRSGLNDAISSMQMRGEWEACSDTYFRGDCQRFTGDVRNLNSTSLNDRISSLRPVRGGGRW